MAPTTASNVADVSVKPLFIRSKDLPDNEEQNYSTREICGQAEKVLGYGTMDGAQRIGGLWRVYPKTNAARMQLLIAGLALRGTQVKFHDSNPFLVRNSDGDRVESTKVFVANLPISLANSEIENALANLGCKLVSKLVDECDRDASGKLTRWKTGRRFAFIPIPASPLPTQVKIGMFTAKIFHKEQKGMRPPTCGNCLVQGHRKEDCTEDVVCRVCRKSGHRSGDILCITPGARVVQSSTGQRETTPEKHPDENTENGGQEESDLSETGEEEMTEGDLSSSSEAVGLRGKSKKKNKRKKNAEGSSSDQSDGPDCATPSRKLANRQSTPNIDVIRETVLAQTTDV